MSNETRPLLLFVVGISLFAALVILGLVGLGSAAPILLAAFVVTYLFFPLAVSLEKRGIRREISVLFVFVILTGLTFLVVLLVVPMIVSEIIVMVREMPTWLAKLSSSANEKLAPYGWQLPETVNELNTLVQTGIEHLTLTQVNPALKVVSGVLTNIWAVVLSILNLFLFPVFIFFVMKDYEKIIDFFDESLPVRVRPWAERRARDINEVLKGYFRGQITVCIFLSIIYSLGFAISQVKFGWLIGLIGGVLSFIPYVGATTSIVGALLSCLGTDASFSVYVGVIITVAIAQSLESFVLTPQLVGNKVGLPPLASLLAIIIGANLGGFAGMLVAIPTAGVLKRILGEVYSAYRNSNFYLRA